MSDNNSKILEIKGLKTYFYTEAGAVKAVDDVSFHVKRGEVLGIVGESGCGKSVTSLSIMRLVGQPGRIIDGQILFDNEDIMQMSDKEMMDIRGNRISMIFQQPQSSLNPVFRIGDQLEEAIVLHQDVSKDRSAESGSSNCCAWLASPNRRPAPAPTRMNCPAAWPSAS